MNPPLKSTLSLLATASLFLGTSGWLLGADPKAKHQTAQQTASETDNATITGEVVDLVCYTDSGPAAQRMPTAPKCA